MLMAGFRKAAGEENFPTAFFFLAEVFGEYPDNSGRAGAGAG
jgi:hypothetical protein